jgi:hypothetical protein
VTPIRSISRLTAWVSLAVLAMASACTKHDLLVPEAGNGALPALEQRSIVAPERSSLRASAPGIATCGAASVFPLTNGSKSPGTVTVSNDATNLYVTYATPAQYWWISDSRLAVEKSAALIPRDGAGNPEPWSFSYVGEHEPPITSFTYTIPLTRVGVAAGQTAYVSAMAGVIHPVVHSEAGLEGAWEWLVTWGAGNTSTTSRAVIHSYVVQGCGGSTPPPPPPPAAGGVVTITFDDGFATVHRNAYPVLKSLGIKGNLAINPIPIDQQWGSYMRMAQVQEIYNNGWSVVSHTMDHKDLTTLSAAAMEAEIRDAKAWIVAKNFGPSEVFIVPFHSWGARERAVIAKYHKYARGHTIDEWWPERYQAWPITQPLDLTSYEPEYAPWRTAQETMAKVKFAVDNGLFLDLLFHQVPDADLATFRELMTQVAAYKANIRTWKEVVQ